MPHRKTESLNFYKYLCQNIGSEAIVKARRLELISSDFASSNRLFPRIYSGSRGEGLDLKGSDIDVMIICPNYVVYESDKYVVHNWLPVLVMDTEDSPPCFTQLELNTNVNNLPNFLKQQLHQHRGKLLLSSKLYKSRLLEQIINFCPGLKLNMHGPCLSDINDKMDYAICLKCDQWVSQAQPWISRTRSVWPSPELISKITLCGTLFVPIGNKGSVNENLQWRISFSVAEKILIYSFSHTQLLCYALLKILLKEIVNEKEELKGLLCSYFLKTLMFWISEENETSVWRPDNIIPCFMTCLKRLLYCIEYSTLLHYFIPDNNLFYLRFNNKQRNTLIDFLKQSYQKGIQVFSSSQTLYDYKRIPSETTRSVCAKTMHTVIGSMTDDCVFQCPSKSGRHLAQQFSAERFCAE
ncbi:cyclic GMP-AMP synthase-like [Mytilus trossulus]|uniref:cyclic GMP-AMP synthase-like n=1 Tax=Mytilus trossulus TaxID=6551 RepID=UPI003006CA55